MHPRPLRKHDYHAIVHFIDDGWGAPTGTLVHPIVFHELGQLARVTEEDDAALLGLVSRPFRRGLGCDIAQRDHDAGPDRPRAVFTKTLSTAPTQAKH